MKYDPRVLGHASDKENGDLKLDMVGKWALRLGLIILPVAYALVDVGVGKFFSDAHVLVGWYISPHGYKWGPLAYAWDKWGLNATFFFCASGRQAFPLCAPVPTIGFLTFFGVYSMP